MAEVKIDIRSDVHQAPDDLRDVNRELDRMEDKAERAAKKLKKIGDSAERIGKKLTLFVTVPLLAAGGAAIKLAMDAEESLAAILSADGVVLPWGNRSKEDLAREIVKLLAS